MVLVLFQNKQASKQACMHVRKGKRNGAEIIGKSNRILLLQIRNKLVFVRFHILMSS